MSVTIRDIAKIAGVSHSTVSRSLNDSCLISDETKEKIKKIAKELGFEFNANARGLSTSKTGTIGLIYPEGFELFNINLFFGQLQSFIRKALEVEALDTIIAFPKNRYTGESNIQKLINRKKVDGLIIVHDGIDDYDLNYAKEAQIPFVFLHHKPYSTFAVDSDCFYTDHFRGGYIAGEHLVKLGHSKIMCITSFAEEFEMRTKGFTAALADNKVFTDEKLIVHGDCSFQSAYDLVINMVKSNPGISAIFAQTDLMALGAIDALRKLDFQVPEKVAVVGYDDIELGTYSSPRLTTVHQPREEIVQLACERLVELVKSKKKKTSNIQKAINPTLVIRESCGCV